MTTSIMFVTYNRLDLTKRMLDSLVKNTNSPYRLIIVDNASTDGTAEWLIKLKRSYLNYLSDSTHCQGLDIHINDKNLGIGPGRNKGLEIAAQYKDPWLSTLDNDVELNPGWLKECIEIMEVNPRLALGLNMENVAYPLVTRGGKTFQVKPAGNLGTACTVFHRDLHDRIGFFNTEYGLYGEEDADFFFRARLVGWDLGYLKDMGVHFGQGELDTGEYREFKDSCRGKNLVKFRQNCRDYAAGQKPYYIPLPKSANNS